MAGNPAVLPHHTSPCSLIHDDEDDEEEDDDDEDDDEEDDEDYEEDGDDDDRDGDYGWKSSCLTSSHVTLLTHS